MLAPISVGQPNGNKQAGGWGTLMDHTWPCHRWEAPGVLQLTTLLSILSCSHPSCSSLFLGQFSVTASSTLGTKRWCPGQEGSYSCSPRPMVSQEPS